MHKTFSARLLQMAAASALAFCTLTAASAADTTECVCPICRGLNIFGCRIMRPAGDAPLTSRMRNTALRYGTWGFDLDGRDANVRPGEDFFRHVNGAFMDALEIPPDRRSYGSFEILDELSETRTRSIIEDAAAGLIADPDVGRIAALYRSFMDEQLIERLDAAPLQPKLAAIRSARTKDELTRIMAASKLGHGGTMLWVGIYDDAKVRGRYAVRLGQAGLGMPDRDYYLTAAFAEKKSKYQEYVTAQLRHIDWPQPEAAAAAMVELETRIAGVSWSRVQSRDADKTYNPMTVAELEAGAPGIPWRVFLEAIGLRDVDRLVVRQPSAVAGIARIFSETPVEVLQAWAAFHLVDTAADHLSKRFADARSEFRDRTLSGQPEQRLRWKRAITFTEGVLGESIGRIYVGRHFSADAKREMEALVENLRTAMRNRVERLAWMGPDTKKRALEKLALFSVKIGYPTRWRDYSGLHADAADLFGNAERSAAFHWNFEVSRLNMPVDREEWAMFPQTVNAYYASTRNEIAFPAAILQPPFFDLEADPAINYGAIGAVIGHEITHGFDDQGRKSDGEGMLVDWWTAEDAAKFMREARRLTEQYAAFEPLPGARINGELTLGENIADLGGLLLALDAYALSLKGAPAPIVGGLTGSQRVFFGQAQSWRRKYREDEMRRRLATDPHSPGLYRVNGVVRNIDAWYDAFKIMPGDPLYLAPDQRVRIW